jgi:hypothetical protein
VIADTRSALRSEMARDLIHSIIGRFEPNLWNNRFPICSTGTLLSIMRHRGGPKFLFYKRGSAPTNLDRVATIGEL